MTPAVPALSRRAEEFARLLEGRVTRRSEPGLGRLVALVRALPRPDVRPDPAFRARLRARLLTLVRRPLP